MTAYSLWGDRRYASEEGCQTGKKASPAKAGVQATITLRHLAAELADNYELSKKQAEAMLGDVVTLTTHHSTRRPTRAGVRTAPATSGVLGQITPTPIASKFTSINVTL